MSFAIHGPDETKIPLFLTITREGLGGVPGKAPVVALRKNGTDEYLDFADNTFKMAGWTTKEQVLVDLTGGHYRYNVSAPAIGVVAGEMLIAEFKVDDGAAVKGAAQDFIMIEDLPVMRKIVTNRLEDFPGNPGTLILYDDDGITPFRSWELRDATGGAVTAAVGAPAKRTP